MFGKIKELATDDCYHFSKNDAKLSADSFLNKKTIDSAHTYGTCPPEGKHCGPTQGQRNPTAPYTLSQT